MKNQAHIKVNVFQIPTVLKNNKRVLFPIRKAEALFYYLLVNKQATRDKLADLFWGQLDEKTAKKYLRNALYTLRKAFDMDIIISPQKQVAMLNEEIKIDTDLDTFLSNKPEGIEAYSGEFLQEFYVKNAENFIEWARNKGEYLRELYIAKLNKYIDENTKRKNEKHLKYYAKLLIDTDEFDERAYHILMKTYADKGAFNKAIEIYNKLSNTLDKELGITPDAKTKELYAKIIDLRNLKEAEVKGHSKDFFFGRHAELQTLRMDYNKFINTEEVQSVIIVGEAGVGKTKLKDEFIKKINPNEVQLLETDCYQAEESYLLKPWNSIFSKIYDFLQKEKIHIPVLWENLIAYLFPSFASEFTRIHINPVEKLDSLKPKIIEDVIINVLSKLTQKKKILLIFEDLQWIDSMSLSLLSNILLHAGNNIFFIGTLRSGYYEEIDTFMTLLSKYNKLKRMEIHRFSREEVDGFVTHALPNHKLSSDLRERLYKETEGNAFFLIEFLNTIREERNINLMTSKMQDILKSRIIDISEEGKKILNIMSLFFDEISLDILKELSGKSEFKIIDTTEELKSKYIIKETGESDEINYKFTHHKLREFIYSHQSLARRRILHNKIGLILERSTKNDKRDILVYPHLIYHFSNAGNKDATLKYSIKNANAYLDISHELFPELSDFSTERNTYLQITKEIAIKYLIDIENLLKDIKAKKTLTEELRKLEIEFLHMKGRHLIREGEYKKGIELIQRVIKNSLGMEYYEYALNGYKQMIFYAIQTHNVHLMEENLEYALDLAKHYNFQKDIGILLRLKGLNQIMSGCYNEAEEILRESIEFFEKLNQKKDKYSLNIAAAYNYIGEIRRCNRNFQDALIFFDKAIAISKSKKVYSSLAIFNTNAGLAAFGNGDHRKAKKYFKEAINMYNHFDTIWGRSTAEGYSALLFVKEGKYEEALKCLDRADNYSKKLKSPYEIGLVYRVKAEIKSKMEHNKMLNSVFSKFLDQGLKEYCDKGINLLKKTKKNYEIDILKSLRKER